MAQTRTGQLANSVESVGGVDSATLADGASAVLFGPLLCNDRQTFRIIVFVAADQKFNLNYEFTPDGGANWYVGQQIASTVVTVDNDTAGFVNAANMDIHVGHQYRVSICNKQGSGTALHYVWENRLQGSGG